MKLKLLVLLFLPVIISSCATENFNSNKNIKNILEKGVWMIGEKPAERSCMDAHYSSDQVEFEFQKSNGRILIYVPFDLFKPAKMNNIKLSENEMTFDTIPNRKVEKFSLRLLNNKEFEIRHLNATAEELSQHKDISTLYYCGSADDTVNTSVPTEQLEILTSLESKPVIFREDSSEASNIIECSLLKNKDKKSDNNWLQFEVFGPAHYYVMGMIDDKDWNRKFDLSPIHSITTVNNKTMKIEVMERLSGHSSWSGGNFRPYNLTIISDGSHIYVPEMKRCFVRTYTLDK